ncbi:hypothetical protein AQJ66_11690 [Streptomyces bungoensis]|uniref:Uncharacterized protein n=1 Tax=Streptomyces bungoensis TaxID=285568 RepID=A0A124I4J4_9ACTN|nr:hypothetical protein [Streptomyces bungoensis]KUN86684.1 hypothetical protein AQJ66_11690 [Streptomyces bungoensis]
MGRYTCTPATAHSAAGADDTLHGDQAWVEPRATGALLSEFLTVLNATQEELGRRWNNRHPAT